MLIAALLSLFLAIVFASEIQTRMDQLDIAYGEMKSHFRSQIADSSRLCEKTDKCFSKLRKSAHSYLKSSKKSKKKEFSEKLQEMREKTEDCLDDLSISVALKHDLHNELNRFQYIVETLFAMQKQEEPAVKARASESKILSAKLSASSAPISAAVKARELESKISSAKMTASSTPISVSISVSSQKQSSAPAPLVGDLNDPFLRSIAIDAHARPSLLAYAHFCQQIKQMSKKEKKKQLPGMLTEFLASNNALIRNEIPSTQGINPEAVEFLFSALEAQAAEVMPRLRK